MDTFTLDFSLAFMLTLPVIASIAGMAVIIIARYLKEIVGDIL